MAEIDTDIEITEIDCIHRDIKLVFVLCTISCLAHLLALAVLLGLLQ